MGFNGCAWVRWGPGDTDGQKNKVNIDKNGYLGHDLGSMVGEISPDMMFCVYRQKVVRMRTDGYECMGSYGCDRVQDNGELACTRVDMRSIAQVVTVLTTPARLQRLRREQDFHTHVWEDMYWD